MSHEQILHHARAVWNFHQLRQPVAPGDYIIAFGSPDVRVAEHAASLYRRGFGKKIVCTGGIAHQNDLLATGWNCSEAEMYAGVLEREGIPPEDVLLESRASNTAENVAFCRKLIQALGQAAPRLVMVTKPYMERRAFATYVVEWPEAAGTVTSQGGDLVEYCRDEAEFERTVNLMVGDLQRLIAYGKRGFSAPQRVPAEVLNSLAALIEAGFDKHVLREVPHSDGNHR